jgi:hypothetical protein
VSKIDAEIMRELRESVGWTWEFGRRLGILRLDVGRPIRKQLRELADKTPASPNPRRSRAKPSRR